MLLNPAQEPRVRTLVSGREWEAAFLKLKFTWIFSLLGWEGQTSPSEQNRQGQPKRLTIPD